MLLVHDGVPDWWALVLLEAGVETGGVDVLVDAAPVVAVELDEMDEVLVPSDVLCEPEPDVELVHPTSTALAAHNNVVNCPQWPIIGVSLESVVQTAPSIAPLPARRTY